MVNTLRPLQVPWQITTGASYLEFLFSDQKEAELKFAGFIVIDAEDHPNKDFCIEKIVPDDLVKHCGFKSSLRLIGVSISVIFKNIFAAKLHPFELTLSTNEVFQFDLSSIKDEFQPFVLINNTQEWKNRQIEEFCMWLTTGICPMPYAFEVYESQWLQNESAMYQKLNYFSHKEMRHYLFRGSDSFVEIIAEKYEWVAEL